MGVLLHVAFVHDDAHETTREKVEWRAKLEMVGLVCCSVVWPGCHVLKIFFKSMHVQKILFCVNKYYKTCR
jgi:hypothetical protein